MPRIFLGSDHRGFVAKQRILATLSQSEWAENYEIVDLGPETMRPDDDLTIMLLRSLVQYVKRKAPVVS